MIRIERKNQVLMNALERYLRGLQVGDSFQGLEVRDYPSTQAETADEREYEKADRELAILKDA